MTLNCLFCADVLRPLDLVPLTDFTYKYHPGGRGGPCVGSWVVRIDPLRFLAGCRLRRLNQV